MQSYKIEDFPWTVIESPGVKFHEQSMAAMRVLSMGKGGEGYTGPERVWEERWKHTAAFYILDPVELGIYMATSLNDRFHYQVLKNEEHIITKIECYCQKLGKKAPLLKRIKAGENYKDDNIVVVHDLPGHLRDMVTSFDDSTIINLLLAQGKFDETRGNIYIDTGFASAKSQTRDPTFGHVSLPSTLKHTDEPAFVNSMVHISEVTDLLCKEYGRLECFRLEGIDKEWAHQIHPKNILQSSRSSLSRPWSAFSPHMDTQNDPRPSMSPVPVIHKIIDTKVGLVRHAKIGYSRKACYEAGIRRDLLAPVVQEVSEWYRSLPTTRTLVNNDLFYPSRSGQISKHEEWLSLPVHCCKTVGLSTYIDAIARLQKDFLFSRLQCVALAYSVVASEIPYYFWKLSINWIDANNSEKAAISTMHPVDLGLYFHQRLMSSIKNGQQKKPPRRHQPHNGCPPGDDAVKQSIVNLIKLCNAMTSLSTDHQHKEYYHSKGLAIIVQSTDKGGCHGAGPLTGQSLLHVLCILGLVPMELSYWGEVAVTPNFLIERGITGTKADQFLGSLSANLDLSLADAEHISCKYGRWCSGSEDKFKDTVMIGQCVYTVSSKGMVTVCDGIGYKTTPPPCQHLAGPDVPIRVDPGFWWVATKGRVRGGNRIPRGKKKKTVKDPDLDEVNRMLPTPRELHLLHDRFPLHISVANLLGKALKENAIPWRKILADHQPPEKNPMGVKTWKFDFEKRDGKRANPDLGNHIYHCALECKLDGVLRYVAKFHHEVMAQWIFQLIEGEKGRKQRDNRDWGDEHNLTGKRKKRRVGEQARAQYYVLHYLEHKKQPRKIAVVCYLSPDRVLLTAFNYKYYSQDKDFFLLDRPE